MLKVVGKHHYVHRDKLQYLEEPILQAIKNALKYTAIEEWEDIVLVRYTEMLQEFSFLQYSSFDEDAFPSLLRSHKVDVSKGSCVYRDYRKSLNPPILHRKELFRTHPEEVLNTWAELTAGLEQIGAFDEPTKIGYRLQWEKLLEEKGYFVSGHQLVPIANDQGNEESKGRLESDNLGLSIKRHLTALSRYSISAPVQQLLRFGLLTKDESFFDYGCGRGDDLSNLDASGYQTAGWDPHFRSEGKLQKAVVVNLGFVLNVIEDPHERKVALIRAFSLAEKVLSVGVMLANENDVKGTPYGDGFLTSRDTFQKYFTQREFIEYLESTTGVTAYAVGPGICFLFKSEELEQKFLISRGKGRSRVTEGFAIQRQRRVRECQLKPREPKFSPFEQNRELLDDLWSLTLSLGREPDPEEVSFLPRIIDEIGSLRKAFRLNLGHQDQQPLDDAFKQRQADIDVFFAMSNFRQREPFKNLDLEFQRDVKYFRGSFKEAQAAGMCLLGEVPDREAVWDSCEKGSELNLGFFDEEEEDYYFQAEMQNEQPALVRAVVGCASVLFGDPSDMDLIKVHIRSSKVSFLKYDDFLGKGIPLLNTRVKVSLRTQGLSFYLYGDQYPCPPLLEKSKYLSEQHETYPQQLVFEEQLQKEDLVCLRALDRRDRISWAQLHSELKAARLEMQGLTLAVLQEHPSLDDKCSEYLTFGELIEVGETRSRLQINNLPSNLESYRALHLLAKNILDPVIDYFGPIKITYGLCTAELRKNISKRVAHDRDQHAAAELKRGGGAVCERGGAACDFFVEDEDMEEVAEWVIANLPFDRLYFYGKDRPLHVSFGPEHSRLPFRMNQNSAGNLYPMAF